MSSKRFLQSLLLAAGCLAGTAQAQVDTLTLNYTKVEWTYSAAQTGALPFALEVVMGEDGSVALLPISGHNVTLKRGQFYPTDPVPQSWLSFELAGPRGQPPAGVLDIVVDQSADQTPAGPGGGPHIKIFDGSNGSASVHTGSAHVLFGDGSVRFIRDSPEVRLSGAPAALFNNPGPGQPLEAHLPTPAPGQTIELKLKIMDDRGASMMLPVKISRPR